MDTKGIVESVAKSGRYVGPAKPGDESLGPLQDLPGTWANLPDLPGRGWNMIALPFDSGRFDYRLLLNQYNETLVFKTVDKGVPNRGLAESGPGSDEDQFLVVLDYEQSINQIAQEDFPVSGKAGAAGAAIHHEPGLWMHMLNRRTRTLDIARLATIPHGNSVLALGNSSQHEGAPQIPPVSGLPIGVSQSLSNPYLEPYKHFDDNLFQGLFTPVNPNALLDAANQGVDIVKTTRLDVHSKIETGGIVNIPFIEKEADAAEMTASFFIQELKEKDENGDPKLRLQYTQTVMLDFFERRDGVEGLIRWPHVSINTMEKVS